MELCSCTACHYCTIYNLCNHHWGRDLHYHHRNSTRRITSRTSGITLYCVKLCRRLLRCHNCITIHNAAARTLPPMHHTTIVMRCNFPCKWVTAWLARLDGWMDSERETRDSGATAESPTIIIISQYLWMGDSAICITRPAEALSPCIRTATMAKQGIKEIPRRLWCDREDGTNTSLE